LEAEGSTTFVIPESKTIFLYVVKGAVAVNGTSVHMRHLVEFAYEGEKVEIKAETDAVILFGHATPFREPFVAYGPFVMNSRDEIMQAYDDYHKGKMGSEEELMQI